MLFCGFLVVVIGVLVFYSVTAEVLAVCVQYYFVVSFQHTLKLERPPPGGFACQGGGGIGTHDLYICIFICISGLALPPIFAKLGGGE